MDTSVAPMPGEQLKAKKMPGHWLLARLGERVLRPGGQQLPRRMIEALKEGPAMKTAYAHISDLAKEAQPPEKGILSHTLFNDDRLKAVIFGFGQGEKLSEHTASMPAILHFLQGDAKLTLGDDTLEATPGTWIHMPTGQRHSIQAKTR